MHQARFRFYEELNDFLPTPKRKVWLAYSFYGKTSVKDAIEAIGIPHVEVDMIIANGIAVDFSYKIKDEDEISVYPVFESLDISGISSLREKPLRVTKFILDVHLGRLSKYLRLCGFDTLFNSGLDDGSIIDLSLKEHRIILTRDRGLLKNKRVTHGYWIRSGDPEGQLKEVLHRFDLKNTLRPFIRCIDCNGILTNVSKEEVIDQLLPNTRDYYNSFKKCTGCGKIYWEGSHYQRMKNFILTISSF